MKKAELFLVILSVITIVLRLFHFNNSGVLTVIFFSLLSLFYFYFSFAFFNDLGFRQMLKKVSFEGIPLSRIVGAVGTGLALSVAIIGILFKLQSYPGADAQLIIGAVTLGVVALVAAFKYRKSSESYYSIILKRVIVIGGFTIFLIVIPAKNWLGFQYPNNPEYVEALLKAQADPKNESLWDEVDVEREKMYGTEE